MPRAGHAGNRLTAGAALFSAVLEKRSGTIISVHRLEDAWSLIKHQDGRIHLEIPEMLEELQSLATESAFRSQYPIILAAGERRAYNANQIYRNPAWRKLDPHGALRMHSLDAATLDLTNGSKARCISGHGSIEVVIQVDDSVRRGVVALPHGYGMRYRDGAATGPLSIASRWKDCRMSPRPGIWSADLLQTNGLGSSLCTSMNSRMAASSSRTLPNTPRRMRLLVSWANQRSTRLIHDP